MVEKLRQLFAEFIKQEKGNKVTDFNVGGLLSSIAFLVEQEKAEQEKAKVEEEKAKKELADYDRRA